MSPEQVLSGKDVDFRADIWGLGVLVYFALTQQIPFNGPTLGAMCVAISRGAFTPVTKKRPQLPAAIDTWMDRALALTPADRFESARAAARALKKAADGIPASVSRTVVMANPDGAPRYKASDDMAAPFVIPMNPTPPSVVVGGVAMVLLVAGLIAARWWASPNPESTAASTSAMSTSAMTPTKSAHTREDVQTKTVGEDVHTKHVGTASPPPNAAPAPNETVARTANPPLASTSPAIGIQPPVPRQPANAPPRKDHGF
jgi:serine/threonine protein kinase